MKDGSPAKRVRSWSWNFPERGRLDGAIKDAAITLAQCGVEAQKEEWWPSAEHHLQQARENLATGNVQQGWVSLQSANRAMLLHSQSPDRILFAAVELRREAEKLSGWRAKAITDLICDEKGELRADICTGSSRMRVINALALRDDHFQTNYFKILLRRRHLFWLFLLLLAGIAASLLLSYFDILPAPFNKVELVAGVVLFGVLGAALSVARGLLSADVSAKIPAQQIGAFVIWMRPAIGAAAALVSFVFLHAKAIRLFDWDPTSPTIIFTIAIVSGFSERFIVGAIERIGEDKDSVGEDKKTDKRKDGSGKDNKRKKGSE